MDYENTFIFPKLRQFIEIRIVRVENKNSCFMDLVCMVSISARSKMKCRQSSTLEFKSFNTTLLHFFFFFFFYHSFILHRLGRRTRPIWTPYDGWHRWDSNLRTPACESPALPLCYGCRHATSCEKPVKGVTPALTWFLVVPGVPPRKASLNTRHGALDASRIT